MSTFLRAEWRRLLMLNYSVSPAQLRPFVPSGVELDAWNGRTWLSVVGFLFLDTRVLGVRLPWHANFEEVNLRFYVRRRGPEGWRRGVVFVKEIVPRRLIAAVARACYNEPYMALPMRHHSEGGCGALREGEFVEYAWLRGGRWNGLRARTTGAASLPSPGSEEEFITEHYWGYTAQRDGGCKQYRVEHPPWKVWPACDAVLDCDAAGLYGPQFAEPIGAPCHSAFVAEGSAVRVGRGEFFHENV